MNALTKDLAKLTAWMEQHQEETEQAENKSAAAAGRFRQKLHLMPPVGWLNDPNGLCQFHGIYHAFFQYSPFDPEGSVKMWGHYTSRNMIDWEYQGTALYPDQPFDCHGVYSGSAFIEDDRIYFYYTGNIKLEDDDADYDYINSGREANTVLVTSKDGFSFGEKKLLMKNSDYPSDLSCHVRDPKVWKDGSFYYMIQGARTKDSVGQALIFRSEDKISWKFYSRVESAEAFGYMWECPDYFTVEGKRVLSASVQGLSGGVWDDRNVYQSGYFLIDGDILGEYGLSEYYLWDYGFDYYAPQSFEAEDGRRIHISWMGMPDCEDDYINPTVKAGWQHCFTIPREIYVKDGVICQRPVRELDEKKELISATTGELIMNGCPVYEAFTEGIIENSFHAELAGELNLDFEDGVFRMHFVSADKTSVSGGRTERYVNMDTLKNVRILADVSSVEVFINDGEYVFTTRYYPQEENGLKISAPGAQITLAEIR